MDGYSKLNNGVLCCGVFVSIIREVPEAAVARVRYGVKEVCDAVF